MPFGAEDMKAPERLDLVAFRFAGLVVLVDDLEERLRFSVCVAPRLAELELRDHFRIAAEHDVRSAPGHVRTDGDRAFAAGLRDHVRLSLVVLCVEHGVRNLLLFEESRDRVALLDAGRADEHGLSLLVALQDLGDDRGELFAFGLVNDVLVILPDHRLIGRDLDDGELVGLVKLGRLGIGRTGHPRELVVEAKEVLKRNRRHRARLLLDAHVLFRLDRLVQTVRPAAPGEHPAGELVDDEDFSVVGDEVAHVALVERMRAQALVENV